MLWSRPGGTEVERFCALLNQVRQGGHLPGAADTIADVLEGIHAQLLGRAEQCLQRIPGFGALLRARPVAHHALSYAPPSA